MGLFEGVARAGGGSSALQLDTQGKAYAQKLLSMEVAVPKSWGVRWPASAPAKL